MCGKHQTAGILAAKRSKPRSRHFGQWRQATKPALWEKQTLVVVVVVLACGGSPARWPSWGQGIVQYAVGNAVGKAKGVRQ